MAVDKRDRIRARRRKLRVRNNIKKRITVPRVSVFRSLKYLYAQIIDDLCGKTLASYSTLVLKDVSGNKKDAARAVGIELAARAKKQGIDQVVFDRGSYRYHGRVQALVEGLREGGLHI